MTNSRTGVLTAAMMRDDASRNPRITARHTTEQYVEEKCIHEVKLDHEKERAEILRRALLKLEGLLAMPQVNYTQCSMTVAMALMEHARKAYR